MEKVILVKVSEELHTAVKIQAAKEGTTIQALVTRILEEATK